MKSLQKSRVVALHRRVRHDYEILETVEAGIMLTGAEAKSCRTGGVQIAGSYVTFRSGKPLLRGMKIALYRFAANRELYEPERERLLLLHERELSRLSDSVSQQGATVIPLEVRAGKYIKVLLGVARGRKKYDKRHTIKQRDMDRRLRHMGTG